MTEANTEKLESIIKVSDLIESCQTRNLITPDDRKKYFEQLNDKIHEAIEDLLKEAD